MYIDSHCHLNMLDISKQSIDDYVIAARSAGVEHILNVSTTLESFPDILATAKCYDDVSCSLGIHPTEELEKMPELEQLLTLAQDDKVIAIGETGLDYYRISGDVSAQQRLFCQHIELAKATTKPLIVHTRQAREDTIKILRQQRAETVSGVLHCFTENWEMAEQALALGFYISFSGIVTFKNARELQKIAQLVPEDRFLIETDAPFLAPTPHRGKPNQPAFVTFVAHYLAELRQTSVEKIAQQSRDNFYRLFAFASKIKQDERLSY